MRNSCSLARNKFEKERFKVAIFMIIVAIPSVIVASIFILPSSWYMLVSFLVLILIMAPFFMIFEHRKPKARELVLLATMSAITAGSHLFLHIVFPVQIGSALVIIAGASLGAESGFLIGAIARFVCNFYMGHGPWTPWQMLCWGILGFLAGLLFNKGEVKQLNKNSFYDVLSPLIVVIFSLGAAYLSLLIWPGKDQVVGWRIYAFGAFGMLIAMLFRRRKLSINSISLSLFTFFSILIIYGGIMNMSTYIISLTANTTGISFDAIRALFITGLPYDLMHAGTATLCIFFIGPNIIKKLERIKIKYGIYK